MVIVCFSQIFWSEDELEMIHQSSVYKETINQKSLIEKEFLAVRPVSALPISLAFNFLDRFLCLCLYVYFYVK